MPEPRPQFSNPAPTAVAATATLLRRQFPVCGHKVKVTGQICGLFGRCASLWKPDKDLIYGENCADEKARPSRAFARGSSLGRNRCASKFGNTRLWRTRATRAHFPHCIMPPSNCAVVRKFPLSERVQLNARWRGPAHSCSNTSPRRGHLQDVLSSTLAWFRMHAPRAHFQATLCNESARWLRVRDQFFVE